MILNHGVIIITGQNLPMKPFYIKSLLLLTFAIDTRPWWSLLLVNGTQPWYSLLQAIFASDRYSTIVILISNQWYSTMVAIITGRLCQWYSIMVINITSKLCQWYATMVIIITGQNLPMKPCYGKSLLLTTFVNVTQPCCDHYYWQPFVIIPNRWYHLERSGSMVECLTQDRGVAGSSLTDVTVLWSLSKTHLS